MFTFSEGYKISDLLDGTHSIDEYKNASKLKLSNDQVGGD